MPYIDDEARSRLRWSGKPLNAGELQYEIALLVSAYVNEKGVGRYQTLNDVMGALSGAAREFYRRIVVPFEDQKMETNGDVYTCAPTAMGQVVVAEDDVF